MVFEYRHSGCYAVRDLSVDKALRHVKHAGVEFNADVHWPWMHDDFLRIQSGKFVGNGILLAIHIDVRHNVRDDALSLDP
jgi:hypothetical protein